MLSVEPSVGMPIARLCGVETPPQAVVLSSSHQLREAIQRLADQIQPWVDLPGESAPVLVALLEGGRFYADRLTSALRERCSADFVREDIRVSTRDGDGRLREIPSVVGDLAGISDQRVLVIDDVLDSGLTLRIVNEHLGSIARELRSTVLVQKDPPGLGSLSLSDRPQADYVGLTFSDARWFSGGGMDMPGDTEGKARNSELLIAYPPVF